MVRPLWTGRPPPPRIGQASALSFAARLLSESAGLSARVVLTAVSGPSTGTGITVRAGESFVVPSGFVGTWEVVEPTTKRFVIYEAAPVPQPA